MRSMYDVIVHCMTEEYYGCRGTHGLVCVAFNRMCCATYWFNPNILLHEKHYTLYVGFLIHVPITGLPETTDFDKAHKV